VKEMKEKMNNKAREDTSVGANSGYLRWSVVGAVVLMVVVGVSSLNMADGSGKQVAIVESHGLIFDLPSFHLDTLQTIKTFNLYLPDDNAASIEIGTRHKDSTNSVHLRGTDGASSITIDGCANIATVVVAGRTHIILQSESRALAAKKPRLYSSEEVFGELQSFHKDGDGTYRRLDGVLEKEAKTSFALAVGEEQIQKFIFAFNKSFDSLYFVVSTFEIQNQVGVNEQQFKLWIQLSANESRLVEIAADGSKKMYDYDLGKIKNTLVTEFDEHGVVKACKSHLPSDTISQRPLNNLEFLRILAGSPCRFEKLNIFDIESFVRLDKVEFDNGPPASLAPVLPQNPGCVKAAYHGGHMPVPPGMVQQITGEALHSQNLQARRGGKKMNPFGLRSKAQKNVTAGRRLGGRGHDKTEPSSDGHDKFPGTNWCGTTHSVDNCPPGVVCGGPILSNIGACCYQHDHGAPEKNSHFPCVLDGLALGCGERNKDAETAEMVSVDMSLRDMFQVLFGSAGLGLPGWDCYLWVDTGYSNDNAFIRAMGAGNGGIPASRVKYAELDPHGIGSMVAGDEAGGRRLQGESWGREWGVVTVRECHALFEAGGSAGQWTFTGRSYYTADPAVFDEGGSGEWNQPGYEGNGCRHTGGFVGEAVAAAPFNGRRVYLSSNCPARNEGGTECWACLAALDLCIEEANAPCDDVRRPAASRCTVYSSHQDIGTVDRSHQVHIQDRRDARDHTGGGIRRRRTRRRIWAWDAVYHNKYEDHSMFGVEIVKATCADVDQDHPEGGAMQRTPPAIAAWGPQGSNYGHIRCEWRGFDVGAVPNNCPGDESGRWRAGVCRNQGNGDGVMQNKCDPAGSDNIDSIDIDPRATQKPDPCEEGSANCCGCFYETCPQSIVNLNNPPGGSGENPEWRPPMHFTVVAALATTAASTVHDVATGDLSVLSNPTTVSWTDSVINYLYCGQVGQPSCDSGSLGMFSNR